MSTLHYTVEIFYLCKTENKNKMLLCFLNNIFLFKRPNNDPCKGMMTITYSKYSFIVNKTQNAVLTTSLHIVPVMWWGDLDSRQNSCIYRMAVKPMPMCPAVQRLSVLSALLYSRRLDSICATRIKAELIWWKEQSYTYSFNCDVICDVTFWFILSTNIWRDAAAAR